MKTIKDLTKEQAIEIAKLIYPFNETVIGEYDFHYQPYDSTWLDDAREFVQVKFRGITFGNTVDELMLHININLDCWFYYCRNNGAHSLPTRNQHAIQKKFIEWEIEPNYEKY
jgi:hypothetical protein